MQRKEKIQNFNLEIQMIIEEYKMHMKEQEKLQQEILINETIIMKKEYR